MRNMIAVALVAVLAEVSFFAVAGDIYKKTQSQHAVYVQVPGQTTLFGGHPSRDSDAVTAALNEWLKKNPEKEIASFSLNADGFNFMGVWIVYKPAK